MPVLTSSGSHSLSMLRPPIGSGSGASAGSRLSSSYSSSKYSPSPMSSSSSSTGLTLPSGYRSRSSYDLMKLSLSPTSHVSSLAFPSSSSPTSSITSSRSSSSSSTGSTGLSSSSSGYGSRYSSSTSGPGAGGGGSSIISTSALSSSPSSSVTLTRFSRRFSTDYNDNDSLIKPASSLGSSSSSQSSPVFRRKKFSPTFRSSTVPRDENTDNNNSSSSGKASKPAHLASGLTNLGNTCYMNAVLQALYSSDALRSYVSGAQKSSLMSSLGRLFEDMRNETGYTSPSAFRSSFIKFQPKFRGYEQQDAQEFLRYLLNGLHEEVNVARRRLSGSTSTGAGGGGRKGYDPPTSSAEAWSQYRSIDDSPLIDMIAGQLSSVITCKVCGNQSTCWDPFWDLSLPLPRGRDRVTIDRCITAFEELEELAHDEKPICDRCRQPVLATKRLSVDRPPSILILHMKRFTNDGYKLSTPRLAVEQTLRLKSRSYSLLAAVCHHGSSSRSGHYTAYCRYAGDRWFHFNDERVTEVRNMESSDSLQDSYILFYVSDSLSTSAFSSRL